MSKQSIAIPSRILYTRFRVSDLDHSVWFYQNVLGMKQLHRESFSAGRFTSVLIGYSDAASNASLELIHNWDPDTYCEGTRYAHLALEVADIYAACKSFRAQGIYIIREPGPMTYAGDKIGYRDTIAYIEDPDGYKIELVQRG
jgi:lactoylglutathione lyase